LVLRRYPAVDGARADQEEAPRYKITPWVLEMLSSRVERLFQVGKLEVTLRIWLAEPIASFPTPVLEDAYNRSPLV
jgi:hypothetical protein